MIESDTVGEENRVGRSPTSLPHETRFWREYHARIVSRSHSENRITAFSRVSWNSAISFDTMGKGSKGKEKFYKNNADDPRQGTFFSVEGEKLMVDSFLGRSVRYIDYTYL